jgi:hypothetical protein
VIQTRNPPIESHHIEWSIVFFASTFLVAGLSYRWVERPFLLLKDQLETRTPVRRPGWTGRWALAGVGLGARAMDEPPTVESRPARSRWTSVGPRRWAVVMVAPLVVAGATWGIATAIANSKPARVGSAVSSLHPKRGVPTHRPTPPSTSSVVSPPGSTPTRSSSTGVTTSTKPITPPPTVPTSPISASTLLALPDVVGQPVTQAEASLKTLGFTDVGYQDLLPNLLDCRGATAIVVAVDSATGMMLRPGTLMAPAQMIELIGGCAVSPAVGDIPGLIRPALRTS